jgi:hypothetical protein
MTMLYLISRVLYGIPKITSVAFILITLAVDSKNFKSFLEAWPTGGEILLTGGEILLTGGETLLTGGKILLTGGEILLTGGEILLTGEMGRLV